MDFDRLLDGRATGGRRWSAGHAAAEQRQHDVYGEILDCAYQWTSAGGRIDQPLWRRLEGLVDAAAREWETPDHGIWVRRGPQDRHCAEAVSPSQGPPAGCRCSARAEWWIGHRWALVPSRGAARAVTVGRAAGAHHPRPGWRTAGPRVELPSGLLALAPAAAGQAPTVLVSRVDGPITPLVAEQLADGVRTAERDGHAALLVELDTPGGLDTSMREITQAFLNARVLVVVYVTRRGRVPPRLGRSSPSPRTWP